MTRLVAALEALGLHGEIAPGGHWVSLRGEQCVVFVVEAHWGGGYYVWCDDPAERAVRHYQDPTGAIQAGLRRAAHPGTRSRARDRSPAHAE